VTDADKTVCDYCEYVREEQFLLDAHEHLFLILEDFEFASLSGKVWEYHVDAKRRKFVLDYVKGHPEYGRIIKVYMKEFSKMGYVLGNMKADAELFRKGRKHLECKCDTHPSSAE